MRRSDLLLLTLVTVLSCSQRRDPDLILSSLVMNTNSAGALSRKVAATGTNQRCMKDMFSIATLEEEIAELERPYLSAPVLEGSWRHIDLSSLKVPEANFLITYGDQIGDIADPEAVDYSGCKNLPCIFNRIYGQDSGVAGLVHYKWFLKFGHMLALDNHVPRQKGAAGQYNGKTFSLRDYLFSQKELYGLWRLTHVLALPHTNIPQLRQIQRVPRGEIFEEEDYKGACGLASNGGWIKLTDKCLVIEQDIDQGHFYPSIVHEMSHQIDYEEGKRLYKASHRSQQQDYLKLSGFYLHEYKDGNGHIHRDWKRKKAPHLTDYADSSPQENFAEVMAWFRMDGDIAAKKMTKDHNDFISGNYYGNRKFTKKWIISAWMDSYASELDQESTRAFINCSGKTNCLAGKIGEIEGEVRAKILIKEAEGCKVLADQIALAYWRKEAEARVKKMLEAHQKSFSTDKNYLARLQGLSDTQSGPGIAAGAFIECSDSDREQECYLEEINRKIEDEKLALTYLSFYPWESISKRSMDAYRTLIMGKQQDLRTRVKKLWKGCLIDPNDTEVPSGDIFLLSEGYMISSLYNCINAHSSEVIKDFVREFHVQHGKEEALLIHETRVSLVKLLKEIYEKENAKEAKGCAPALPLYHLKKELINPACSPPKTRP